MHVQTKFLRFCKPVALGDQVDDWRVSWLGGWDKCRVFFVVMVERENSSNLSRLATRVCSPQNLPRSK